MMPTTVCNLGMMMLTTWQMKDLGFDMRVG
jgi:hypothetical protein